MAHNSASAKWPTPAEAALQTALEELNPETARIVKTTNPVVQILGVEYYIDWSKMRVGDSFFLKTSATAAMVKSALRKPAGPLWKSLHAHNRCEFGYYGVRVWRLG